MTLTRLADTWETPEAAEESRPFYETVTDMEGREPNIWEEPIFVVVAGTWPLAIESRKCILITS